MLTTLSLVELLNKEQSDKKIIQDVCNQKFDFFEI